MQLPGEDERFAALSHYNVLDSADEDAFDEITRLAAFICGTPITLVTLVDRDRQWFKSRVGMHVRETPRDIAFCDHAIRGDDAFIVPDARQDARFSDNPLVTEDPHIRFYAGVPLTNREGFNLGTLCVIDRVPRELNGAQVEALRILARQVMAQLELRKQAQELKAALQEKQVIEDELRASREKLRALSLTDELTGLHNRRSFNERFQESIHLANRYDLPLSLLLFDADNFKSFNDTFGHPAGDQVLATLAHEAKRSFRATDFCARIGGEEFAIILPNTSADGSLAAAKKFAEALRGVVWANRPVTVSIGISTRDRNTESTLDLMGEADKALYRAKLLGRNRVVHVQDIPGG